MPMCQDVKKDEIAKNESANAWVQKVIQEMRVHEQWRTKDRWGHSGNEGAKNWEEKISFSENSLLIVMYYLNSIWQWYARCASILYKSIN